MKKVLFAGSVLAQSIALADGGSAAPGGIEPTLLMIGLAVVFFYFILWRPEQKRRKKMQSLRDSMKKGDRVTAMGIVGTVHEIKDKTVVLASVDGSKIEMLKGAISEIEASN
jgi:preprotein translocase subunit YajC